MELQQLLDELDDIRPDDEEAGDSLEIIMTKVGQMATGAIALDGADDREGVDEYRRDLFAGLVIAAAEYAAEHELDAETAVEERLERMRDEAERRREQREALDEMDAGAFADALSGDGETSVDGEGSRGFQ